MTSAGVGALTAQTLVQSEGEGGYNKVYQRGLHFRERAGQGLQQREAPPLSQLSEKFFKIHQQVNSWYDYEGLRNLNHSTQLGFC